MVAIGTFCAPAARGYFANGRWSHTATDGATDPLGSPVTVTWSLVPDGTTIPGRGTSSFVAFMDGLFGGGSGTVAERVWFPLVQQSFDRWTELGGLSFVYEPADDGVNLGGFAGVIGTRGDVRIGGVLLDGPGGTNAQTGFLDNGDITVDTGDGAFFGNPAGNSLDFRNTLTHEIGHALGLGHIDSTNAAFLMEPFSDDTIDGPQLDDIRGLHFLYGDAWERTPAGPNNAAATATMLGELTPGATLTIGLDGAGGAAVLPTETDFASIANNVDEDWFEFTVPAAASLDVTLTPTGPNYFEKPTGIGSLQLTRSSRISDLSLELYESDGGEPELVATANLAPVGQPELLSGILLNQDKTYFARILGDANDVQLYHLSLATAAAGLPGDFNGDGAVDGGDFLHWQREAAGALGPADLDAWGREYGRVVGASAAVPEPSAIACAGAYCVALIGLFAYGRVRRARNAPSRCAFRQRFR
ncbi:MAG: hypothetical protein CMJ58_04365 [Planctomycetaceae bacterium]|nr:hypothetical protein [Planctomycetaceae bacterium]